MQLSPKFVRFLVALAILAGGVVLFAGYYFTQITANIDVNSLERPTRYDAKEVRRKMKLLDDSRTNAVRGFIRLAEVELNSFLHERHGGAATGTNSAASAPAPGGLQNCRVDLTETNITLYCWVRKPWLGRSWNLVWQRTAALKQDSTKWGLELQSMSIGRVRIPPAYWPQAEEALGGVDAGFVEDFKWLQTAPAIALIPAEVTKRPELRIFNHPETNAPARPPK